jgi:AraC-like DNA-binding protein
MHRPRSSVCFSTEGLTSGKGFSAFREAAAETFPFLEFSAPDVEDYSCELRVKQIGNLAVFQIDTAALSAEITPQSARRHSSLAIQFFVRGGVRVEEGKTDLAVAPGGALFAPVCASIAHYQAGTILRSLMVSAERLSPLLGAGWSANKLAAIQRGPALNLLEGWLASAPLPDEEIGPELSSLFEKTTIDLLALALGATGDERARIEETSIKAARTNAVLKLLRRSALDPQISARVIGRALGVTDRYVHKLLEKTGRTFAEHVLDERLQHASRLLRDTPLKISGIAHAAGFSDISYFNRVFRRRFGMTPSEARTYNSRDCE